LWSPRPLWLRGRARTGRRVACPFSRLALGIDVLLGLERGSVSELLLLGVHGELQAILVLTDLTLLSVPDETRLSLVFSLTAAEAKLAKTLASGHGIDAAATSLRVNRETARSQLKAVFAKTNTCRQAELVALVARFRPSL